RTLVSTRRHTRAQGRQRNYRIAQAGGAAKNCQMTWVAFSACDVGSAPSRAVLPPGHPCRPPSMVINTTLRLSAHAAVDVVTGALVVTSVRPQWSTLRQNALTSAIDGPLTKLAPCPPLYGTSRSAVPWMWITDVGCGAAQASSWVAESGPMAAKMPLLQASA